MSYDPVLLGLAVASVVVQAGGLTLMWVLGKEASDRRMWIRAGVLLGLVLLTLALVGEVFAWPRVGRILAVIGGVVTIWFGAEMAGDRTVTRLQEPLRKIRGDLASIRATLERIEERLRGRP
jgi:hypothetical protein